MNYLNPKLNLFLTKTLSLLFILAMMTCAKASAQTSTTAPSVPENREGWFTNVAQAASFPGGMQALGQYLSDNIKYPRAARKKNISGTVYVNFIVEADGSLSSFRILKQPDETLGQEAIRVMKASPKWNPAKKKDGRFIKQQYTVPINFSLTNEKTKSDDSY